MNTAVTKYTTAEIHSNPTTSQLHRMELAGIARLNALIRDVQAECVKYEAKMRNDDLCALERLYNRRIAREEDTRMRSLMELEARGMEIIVVRP